MLTLIKYFDNLIVSERNNDGNNFTENNSENSEMIKNVQHYKMITDIMEKHLNDPKNLFCKLINEFIKFYINKYQTFINQKESYSIQERKKLINQAKNDLKQFIRILSESLKLFYSLNKLNSGISINDKSKRKKIYKENLFTCDNIINFITSIMFQKPNMNKQNSKHDKGNKLNSNEKEKDRQILKDEDSNLANFEIDIYSIVIEILSIEDLGQGPQGDYFNFVESYEPQEFGLDPRFCLNMRTIEYLENKHKRKFILPLKDNILYPLKSSLTHYPYGKAIAILRTIDQQRSPLHKLKVISKTAKAICTCIKEFYDSINMPDFDKLDGDNTLSVFMYLTSKLKIKDIKAQCDLSLNFTTDNVLNSIIGYYLTTLEACVEYIISLGIKNSKDSN